jgi:putative SOS response-associated peptidase YedK
MCGRATQISDRERLQRHFDLKKINAVPKPTYNLAPMQPILAIVNEDGSRVLEPYKWGLVPFWADDPKIGQRMINARAEGIAEKPAFREAFKKQRCIVPVDGFYEWKKDGDEKIPFYFRMKDEEPFGLAGLWESNDKFGEPIQTCAIITTEANALMASLHDRMPAILSPEEAERWLDPDASPKALLRSLHPFQGPGLTAYRVSKQVNNVRHNAPDCIEEEAGEGRSPLDRVPDEQTRNSK